MTHLDKVIKLANKDNGIATFDILANMRLRYYSEIVYWGHVTDKNRYKQIQNIWLVYKIL